MPPPMAAAGTPGVSSVIDAQTVPLGRLRRRPTYHVMSHHEQPGKPGTLPTTTAALDSTSRDPSLCVSAPGPFGKMDQHRLERV